MQIDNAQQNSNKTKFQAYAKNFGLPFIELKGKNIPSSVINIIPKNVALDFKIVAYEYQETPQKNLKIAVANPERLKQKAPDIVIDLKKKKGINIQLAIVTEEDFNWAMSFYEPVKENVLKKEIPVKSQQSVQAPGTIKTMNLRPLPTHLEKPLDVNKSVTPSSPDKPQPTKKIVQQSANPTKEINKPIDNQVTSTKTAPVINKTQTQYSNISLKGRAIPFAVLSKFPQEVAKKHQMVVFSSPIGKNIIRVGAVAPENEVNKRILDFIKKKNNINIEVYKISQEDFDYVFNMYNKGQAKPVLKDETSIPSVSPLPNINKRKLPPLKKFRPQPLENDIKQNQADKEDLKPVVKEDKVQTVNQQDVKGIIETSTGLAQDQSQENNLDVLIPNGVKTSQNLTEIIKGGMVPKIVASIIYYAVEQDASDIHLEPNAEDLRLRYRLDGVLQDIVKMPIQLDPPTTSRIKIMSGMRIDEQRIPQDGRISVQVGGKEIDIRVSTMPTVFGEKIVMRLLDKSAGLKDIKELGFQGTNLKRVMENIQKPYGIIFTTGPTGCGKTTTLYSILKELNKPNVNIVTFEDPVEYEIQGVNQCNVKPKIGFTFAEGLRSVLRQDPNVIMVGEVRDSETAAMSVHAALTGHIVLSTLHTNTAAGAMPRLINMGIEPFLITSSVNCVIAQRLVRKLCPKCRIKFTPPAPILEKIKLEISSSKNPEITVFKDKKLEFWKPKGCAYCKNGYKGRIGIYEVLSMSAKIEDLSVHKSSADVIQKQAIDEGMITIRQDGIIKSLQGLTSLDEVLKETND